MGVRDGPSIRQVFDGVRFSVQLRKARGDFFIIQPVSYQYKVFDNIRNKNTLIYSSYWTIPVSNNNILDIYYFGNKLENFKFGNDTADESRNSLGLRFSNNINAFYYDAEITYQFGKFGVNKIVAYQIGAIAGYRWPELNLRPRVQFRESIMSENRLEAGGIINTFRPVSARPPVNDMVPVGPANIIVISPEGEITIYKGMTLVLRYLATWRLSEHDGIYSGDAKIMIRKPDEPGNNQGKLITKGMVAEIAYNINKHLNLVISGGHFIAGEYIVNTGKGEPISAFSLRTTYKF